MSRKSILALTLAVVLFLLDGGPSVVFVVRAGGDPPIGGAIARMVFLIPMIQGFGAIKTLNRDHLDGQGDG